MKTEEKLNMTMLCDFYGCQMAAALPSPLVWSS